MTTTGFPTSALSETGACRRASCSSTTVTARPLSPESRYVGTDGIYALTNTATNGVAPDATQGFTLTVAVAVAPTVTLLDPNTGPEAGGTFG